MYDNIVISEFTYAKDITTRPERSNSWFSKLISDSTTVTSTNSTSNHTNAQPVHICINIKHSSLTHIYRPHLLTLHPSWNSLCQPKIPLIIKEIY